MSDAQSAPDAASAAVIAADYGHPVVVSGDTTATEQTSALPDGAMQLTESSSPVRVQRGGGWVPVDTTLAVGSDGMVAPAAVVDSVEFSDGGSGPMFTVGGADSDGAGLSVQWPDGALPVPTLSGDTATYSNVLPGVNLDLTATATGMQQVLVITSVAAAADSGLAALSLAISGATRVTDTAASGAAVATAGDGSVLATAGAAWWDSSQGGTVDGPGGTATPEPVAAAITATTETVNAQAPAQQPGVQFPVFVDPAWNVNAPQGWTFTDQAYPNQSYWASNGTDGWQHVGYVDAGDSDDGRAHTTRSYWQMDTSGIEGKDVLSALFATTEGWSFSCSPRQVDLYVSGIISPSTTWNNPPAQDALVATANVAHGYNSSCPSALVPFNATSAAQSAAADGWSNITLELKADNESDAYGWKKFTGTASLTVTYQSYPNMPTSLQFTSPPRVGCGTQSSPIYVNGNQPITFQADLTDADAGQNVWGAFFVVDAYNGNINELPSSTYPNGYMLTPSQAQGNQSVTLAAGTLGETNPGFYAWRVLAQTSTPNGTIGGPSTGWCYFKVKDTGPGLPQICAPMTSSSATCSAPSTAGATVGQPFSVQFQTAPSDAVAVLEYWWGEGTAQAQATVPVPFGTGSPTPPCGSVSGPVHFVCLDTSGNYPAGASSVVTVAPVDDDPSSTLYVASYDQAMNVSSGTVTLGGSSYTSAAAPWQVTPSIDSADVNFSRGHGWYMEQQSAPYASITDQNTSSSGLPLTIGGGAGATTQVGAGGSEPPGPNHSVSQVLSLPGYWELDRINNGSYHSVAVESEYPSGFYVESALGQFTQTEASGQVAIYSCVFSNGEMVSKSSTCEGTGVTGQLIGYVWSSSAGVPAPATAVAIYRCHTTASDHFLSTFSNCEGQASDGLQFYLANLPATQTASAALASTTASYTVSAWLYPTAAATSTPSYYTALSQSGATNTAFYLQDLVTSSGAQWRFCVRAQTVAEMDCAVATATQNTWTYVTGIWDAANQQVRLVLNALSNEVAVTTHVVPGDTSATGPLLVGSAETGGEPNNQWSGYIDDPVVFPGVADLPHELTDLFQQQATP